MPERMREEVDRAEQDLEQARVRHWPSIAQQYATREEAERIAAVANWLIPRFATREAELPVLAARIHECQAAYGGPGRRRRSAPVRRRAAVRD